MGGTKVTVNGEIVTDVKNVTNVNFYASGGIKWNDNDKLSPYVNFNYDAINKNSTGVEIGESFTFRPDNTIEKGTIGSVKEKVSDFLVGKDSVVISNIIELSSKISHYVPSKDELIKRTFRSLSDMLTDLEKEIEGK